MWELDARHWQQRRRTVSDPARIEIRCAKDRSATAPRTTPHEPVRHRSRPECTLPVWFLRQGRFPSVAPPHAPALNDGRFAFADRRAVVCRDLPETFLGSTAAAVIRPNERPPNRTPSDQSRLAARAMSRRPVARAGARGARNAKFATIADAFAKTDTATTTGFAMFSTTSQPTLPHRTHRTA